MNKKIYYTTKIIQYILGLVFLISGIGKLIDSNNARLILDHFLGNSTYNLAIIIFISVIELFISISLFLEIKTKISLGIAFLLLVCFTSGLGYLYVQNISVNDCGCFGAFDTGMGIEASLFKNFILIALIAITYLLYETKETRVPAIE